MGVFHHSTCIVWGWCTWGCVKPDRCRIFNTLQKLFLFYWNLLGCSRTKFLVLQSLKTFQRPLHLADPALPPASVVNSTTSTTPTMKDLLIGGVSHLQVLDPLGSAPS